MYGFSSPESSRGGGSPKTSLKLGRSSRPGYHALCSDDGDGRFEVNDQPRISGPGQEVGSTVISH